MMSSNTPTLGDVYDLLTSPDFSDPQSVVVEEMGNLGGAARSAAGLISQLESETFGSVLSNALQNMNWLESDARREGFGHADFSPLDINTKKLAAFFVEAEEELGANARPLRVVFSEFFSAAMKGRKVRGKGSTLFIIDEAYALDRSELLLKRIAVLRKRGARAWLIWTNKGQVHDLYGKNAETFFANAGQVQIFAINDHEGAEYVSGRIGKWVRWKKKTIRTNGGVEEEWQPSGSFLRDGPEINKNTGRESGLQIVLNEGGDPFLLRRTSYRKMFKPGEYDPDPYEPAQDGMVKRAIERILDLLKSLSRK
jgi:type IV secretory pathway TraG/TraD family ATPase VirD4